MRKLSPTNKGLNLFFLTTKTSLWILLAKSKPKFQEFSVACPDCNLCSGAPMRYAYYLLDL